jgi:murein DD-endopeptidase MepM/ murein hydrolase activator NlpD
MALFLVRSILSQWFDPRHEHMEANRKLIQLAMAVDSLSIEVQKKQQFIEVFQRITYGDDEAASNQLLSRLNKDLEDSLDIVNFNKEIDIESLVPIDSQFRIQYEGSSINLLTNVSNRRDASELLELYFFAPINGIISSPFAPKIEHYGVDIVAKTNEPVKCVADGTVIMASWSQEYGHTIAVQHRNNLMTVYKHNSAVLKKVGAFVNAGEIISIIGNSGELTTGPHLHFEMWYDGNPVDPENYISF